MHFPKKRLGRGLRIWRPAEDTLWLFGIFRKSLGNSRKMVEMPEFHKNHMKFQIKLYEIPKTNWNLIVAWRPPSIFLAAPALYIIHQINDSPCVSLAMSFECTPGIYRCVVRSRGAPNAPYHANQM